MIMLFSILSELPIFILSIVRCNKYSRSTPRLFAKIDVSRCFRDFYLLVCFSGVCIRLNMTTTTVREFPPEDGRYTGSVQKDMLRQYIDGRYIDFSDGPSAAPNDDPRAVRNDSMRQPLAQSVVER